MKLKKYSGSKELEAQHILINQTRAEIRNLLKKRAVSHGNANQGIQAVPKTQNKNRTYGKYYGG